MGRIVTVTTTDQTRPVTQQGFKSVLLCDFETDRAAAVMTNTEGLEGSLLTVASAFFKNGGESLVVVGAQNDSAGIPAALSGINEEHDFYGIISTAVATEDVTAISNWAGANGKLFITEAVGSASGPIITLAETLNSERTVVFANYGPGLKGIAGAVAGMGFRRNVGSFTWGNQYLDGNVLSGYSLAEQTALVNANVNVVIKIQGNTCTYKGKTTSGSSIDVTRSKDWLKARLVESVEGLLIRADKIPYTDEGISQITATMDGVGVQAVGQAMLAEFLSSAPKVADIPQNDKANRVLNNVVFTARLAGAIESINISLIITL